MLTDEEKSVFSTFSRELSQCRFRFRLSFLPFSSPLLLLSPLHILPERCDVRAPARPPITHFKENEEEHFCWRELLYYIKKDCTYICIIHCGAVWTSIFQRLPNRFWSNFICKHSRPWALGIRRHFWIGPLLGRATIHRSLYPGSSMKFSKISQKGDFAVRNTILNSKWTSREFRNQIYCSGISEI